ncbi:MAG: branched-chain amino acid ABC transporter permease [Alphaproteobacteria bacterium]|nr:branched-chain amino acid ABC transporter permease [Alphaproteobacteria bacterium]
MTVYLDIVASGVLTGLVYGLMALGLSVIFGVVRVVNFAHGELTVAAMYMAWVMAGSLGVDPILTLPLIAAALFAIGYALQRHLVEPFIGRPEHEQFMLLLAVSIIVLNGLLLVFGPDARHVAVDYAYDSFELGPMLLDTVRVYAAAAAMVLALGLYLFFRFTDLGTAIRACADNLLGAQVVGLDVRRLYALTFGLGCALVGASGTLMVLMRDATPILAVQLTLLAFIVVIIGGLGSMAGALVGGVLIGVSEALAGFLLMPSLKSLFSYGLLILVLLLRPEGLMGRRA